MHYRRGSFGAWHFSPRTKDEQEDENDRSILLELVVVLVLDVVMASITRQATEFFKLP